MLDGFRGCIRPVAKDDWGGSSINTIYRIVHQYSPDSRLLFAVFLMVVSLYLGFNVSQLAALLTTAAFWLIWDALRHGSVWYGFSAFRRGDLAAVRYSLVQMRWPNLLDAESQAYYHWLKGVIEMADTRFAAAKVHLLVAATGPLRTENDRSLLHCLLAEIALQETDKVSAKEHLRHARALQHRPEVERIISKLSERLNR